MTSNGAWREVQLGDICELKYGKSLPEAARTGGDIYVYGSNGVVGRHNQAITDGPTIIVGRKGSFGEVNLSPQSCWPIDTTYFIDRTATRNDLKWLTYRLKSLGLNKLNKAAAVPGLNRDDAYRQRLMLPPLAEQRRIAGILDKAEALRAKRRAVLAKIDSLPQAIFLELFGDPRSNEKGWEKITVSAVLSDVRGGASLEPEDFVERGFPILHKGAIKPCGQITLDSKKKTFATAEYAAANQRSVVDRDFLAVTLRDLVPTGPSIGLVADLRKGGFDKYLLAQGAYAFRVNSNRIVQEYFVYLSNMPTFRHVLRQNAVGSTQIHIRTPVYLAIKIPLPPIELQREFARRMSAVEKLKAAQRASLAKLDALFASLQHRAFRGEL